VKLPALKGGERSGKNELMATVNSAIQENLDLEYGKIHRKKYNLKKINAKTSS